MVYCFDTVLRGRISANLAGFAPRTIVAPDARHAAVGVVLLADETDRACFVLTRRLTSLRRHSGQWALPGGRLDSGETAEEAALREIFEEVGLPVSETDVLGRLDDFLSRSGHLITPFVIWSLTSALTISPDEVDAAFTVRLDELDRDGNPRFEPLLHFALIGSKIFAPTAAILYHFREVALHNRPLHLGEVEQPRFAWR